MDCSTNCYACCQCSIGYDGQIVSIPCFVSSAMGAPSKCIIAPDENAPKWEKVKVEISANGIHIVSHEDGE